MVGNNSAAFPESLSSTSASLFNQLFKAPLFFDGEPPPPKTPVIASAIVEIVIERVVSTEVMVIFCL